MHDQSQISIDTGFLQRASHAVGFIPQFQNNSSHDAIFFSNNVQPLKSNCQTVNEENLIPATVTLYTNVFFKKKNRKHKKPGGGVSAI